MSGEKTLNCWRPYFPVSLLCSGSVSQPSPPCPSQVEAELQYPQLPYLESVTSGKAILVTQYVLKEFVSIVSVVGGEQEKERAERFLKKCW